MVITGCKFRREAIVWRPQLIQLIEKVAKTSNLPGMDGLGYWQGISSPSRGVQLNKPAKTKLHHVPSVVHGNIRILVYCTRNNSMNKSLFNGYRSGHGIFFLPAGKRRASPDKVSNFCQGGGKKLRRLVGVGVRFGEAGLRKDPHAPLN